MSHTPDFSFPLSPEQELLREKWPESYPCYTEFVAVPVHRWLQGAVLLHAKGDG